MIPIIYLSSAVFVMSETAVEKLIIRLKKGRQAGRRQAGRGRAGAATAVARQFVNYNKLHVFNISSAQNK